MSRGLSPQELHTYEENGFISSPKRFNAEEIAEVGACVDRLIDLAGTITETTMIKGAHFVVQGDRIDRIVWCGAAEPRLLEYAVDPRILEPVSQILGSREMQQLICQVHPKLPGDAVAFDWHQDSQHRRYGTDYWRDLNGKGSFVQSMLAIDPITVDNGPVLYIPGSHKLGHLSLEKPENVARYVESSQAVPLLMEPGDLAFFGPYVIHGSQPNNSAKRRRVLINGFAYPGANSKLYPGDGSGRFVRLTGC